MRSLTTLAFTFAMIGLTLALAAPAGAEPLRSCTAEDPCSGCADGY